MGLRFRRRIPIVPGLRVNVSRSGHYAGITVILAFFPIASDQARTSCGYGDMIRIPHINPSPRGAACAPACPGGRASQTGECHHRAQLADARRGGQGVGVRRKRTVSTPSLVG